MVIQIIQAWQGVAFDLPLDYYHMKYSVPNRGIFTTFQT